MKRRHFLQSTTAAASSLVAFSRAAVAGGGGAALLPLTNPQGAGPFYPLDPFNDTTIIPEGPPDNDLVIIHSRDGIMPAASGKLLHFNGQVLNPSGCAIPHAVVELWNTDANGWYIDPEGAPLDAQTTGSERDVLFQGFGSVTTNEYGAFSFRTIRPVPYLFAAGLPPRPSHLHVAVKVQGQIKLITQLYFSDEIDELIPNDVIHGLTVTGPNTNLEPNLLRPSTTLDAAGNEVITAHKNLVIDHPSEASADQLVAVSELSVSDSLVTMNLTPGCLVDIQSSMDLIEWKTIATSQSVLFGKGVPAGKQATFYRAQRHNVGT